MTSAYSYSLGRERDGIHYRILAHGEIPATSDEDAIAWAVAQDWGDSLDGEARAVLVIERDDDGEIATIHREPVHAPVAAADDE